MDLPKVVYNAGLGYLAVGNIAADIEFLGACLDPHEFVVERVSFLKCSLETR